MTILQTRLDEIRQANDSFRKNIIFDDVKICTTFPSLSPDIIFDALERVRHFDDFKKTEHDPFIVHVGGEIQNGDMIIMWNLLFRDKNTGLEMVPDREEDPTKIVELYNDNKRDYEINTLEIIISKPMAKI